MEAVSCRRTISMAHPLCRRSARKSGGQKMVRARSLRAADTCMEGVWQLIIYSQGGQWGCGARATHRGDSRKKSPAIPGACTKRLQRRCRDIERSRRGWASVCQKWLRMTQPVAMPHLQGHRLRPSIAFRRPHSGPEQRFEQRRVLSVRRGQGLGWVTKLSPSFHTDCNR